MLFNSITHKKYLCWPNILQAIFGPTSNCGIWKKLGLIARQMPDIATRFEFSDAAAKVLVYLPNWERDNAKQFSLSCLDCCLGELVIWCFIQGLWSFMRYIYAPLHSHDPVWEWEWMKIALTIDPNMALMLPLPDWCSQQISTFDPPTF